MQRLFLTVLLAGCATAASADWTRAGGAAGIYTAYADTARSKRNGERVSMWTLYDFDRTDFALSGERHQSTDALREYDCKGARVRLLAYVDYAGQMGSGKIISSNGDPSSWQPGRWEPVIAGAVDVALLEIACGR